MSSISTTSESSKNARDERAKKRADKKRKIVSKADSSPISPSWRGPSHYEQYFQHWPESSQIVENVSEGEESQLGDINLEGKDQVVVGEGSGAPQLEYKPNWVANSPSPDVSPRDQIKGRKTKWEEIEGQSKVVSPIIDSPLGSFPSRSSPVDVTGEQPNLFQSPIRSPDRRRIEITLQFRKEVDLEAVARNLNLEEFSNFSEPSQIGDSSESSRESLFEEERAEP